MEYAFDFMEAAFYNSQEMVMFVSGINTDFYCVRFLETYECERYVRYNKELLFEDRGREASQKDTGTSGIGSDNFLGNGSLGNTAVHCLFFYVTVGFRFVHGELAD